MGNINTVSINGEEYGLLVITDSDMDAYVYAVPLQIFNDVELLEYQGIEQQELPEVILDKIENGEFIKLEIAYAASV